MVPVMRSAAGPGLLPALLPCPALRITPPRCAKRPALPVSRAVSGRAVANDIFGGCWTGVNPWCDRLMEPRDLTPDVHRGAASQDPAPEPPSPGDRVAPLLVHEQHASPWPALNHPRPP